MEDPIADLLQSMYISDPCGTLPNALWKTLKKIPEYQVVYSKNQSNHLLQLWDGDRLVHHYQSDDEFHLSQEPFAIIHTRYVNSLDLKDYDVTKYFRLIHHLLLEEPSFPHEITFQEVSQDQSREVADFLNLCYDTEYHNEKQVREWQQSPVYSPTGWFWLKYQSIPIGLSITDFDPMIKEVSLEWIQIHPDYRNRGFGKLLVNKALCVFRDQADFATVSGRMDNETNPLKLYRSCGFTGNDIWFVLKKKQNI